MPAWMRIEQAPEAKRQPLARAWRHSVLFSSGEIRMATPTVNRPTPDKIFNTLSAFQASAALGTGIELDIFSAIAEGLATPASLAQKTGASERGLRILCDCLTIHVFLTKETKEKGQYGLTQDSAVFL